MIKQDKGDDHHVRELCDTLRSVYSEVILVSLAKYTQTHTTFNGLSPGEKRNFDS